jgi:adenylylsulfate kinase
MITWLTGNTGAGKTWMARRIRRDEILLDGDSMRKIWKLGFTKEDRIEHNLRIARLAALLEQQGYDVIVSTICPYKELRKEIKKIAKIKFVYLEGGQDNSTKYPYDSFIL